MITMGNDDYSNNSYNSEGFFKRFKNFIKTVFLPVKVDEMSVNETAESLYGVTRDDLSRSYDDVRRASLLCERALIIAGRRADLAVKQQILKDKIVELEKFEKLPDEKKQYITNVLLKYRDIINEKRSLRGQLSSFTKVLSYLEPYEKDVPDAIKAIDEAEDMQRRVKQDMNYIEGERADLEYQKQSIEYSIYNIYRISIGITVVFSISAVLLMALYFLNGVDIFYFGLYTAIAMITLYTLLYIFRRRLIFESKLNVLLQIRAVELLNKKKLLYVHYTGFLNYEYKKYRVKSAYELMECWNEYDYYKHVSTRYSNVRNIAYTVEDDLHAFLLENGLHRSKTSVENFALILDFEKNKKEYMRFTEQLSLVEGRLIKLDIEQNEVWDEFILLKERDTTKEKIIERMMNEYFEDISKVSPIDDEEDEFNYGYKEDED